MYFLAVGRRGEPMDEIQPKLRMIEFSDLLVAEKNRIRNDCDPAFSEFCRANQTRICRVRLR